jgi:hypothetical protein
MIICIKKRIRQPANIFTANNLISQMITIKLQISVVKDYLTTAATGSNLFLTFFNILQQILKKILRFKNKLYLCTFI